VGRRWLLKVGGAGFLALLTNAPGRAAAAAAADALDAHALPQVGERRNVYLVLPRSRAFTPFAVRAAGRDHPVRRITSVERHELGATRGLYSAINVGRLTHVAEQVPFPTKVPVLLSVLARRRGDGRVGLIAQRMSVPRLTALKVARAGIAAAG